MIDIQVTFNSNGLPDNTFIGSLRQYAKDTYILKAFLPDGFDTGYTIGVNIERADGTLGTYAMSFVTDHWELTLSDWVTTIEGELKLSITATDVNEDIYYFKLVQANIEFSVDSGEYDPEVDVDNYNNLLSVLAGKQPLDGDLTAIANLSATSGVLTKVSANNWALSTDYFALVNGVIPAEYLPTYVDDVIEGILVNSTSFTVGGNVISPENGKIYVSTTNEKVYRWSGSLFVEISSQITVGNLTGQAFDGALGNQAYINAAAAFGWGNHANASYLTASSTTITNISNNVANLQGDLGNLTNTVSDTNNLVSTINGSYLTASSETITDIINTANQTTTDLGNLTNVVANKVNTSLIGANNGIASLDNAGKVPSSQLPSFVDDVLEYANLAGFPVTGETGKIYVAIDTGLTYRWSGSIYVEISQSLALGNTSATAFRGDLGKEAYDWGNHANGGYLTVEADTLDTVATRGNSTNAISVNYVSSLQTIYNSATEYGGVNAGEVGWSSQYGTLQVGLLNGAYAKVGQSEMYYGKATETITKGQVVMSNGSQGDFIKLSLANPSVINNNPDYMLGLATTNIANDGFGYATKFGYIDGVSTETFTNGTIIWFDSNSSNASGGITDVKPVAPNAKIQLAAVVKASSTPSSQNGRLLVRVATGSQLGGTDSNVELTNVANGEVLAYNGSANRWENKEVVSLGLNVALTNIANDQYLAYDNGVWINRDLNAVTTTQITNWDNTYNIVDANSGNWNSAFSWGNHQAVGYIVGLADSTVTDGNIAAFNGTTGKLLKDTGVAISGLSNIGNWDTAFSWGNHANAGYGNVVGAGTVVSGNVATFNGTTGAILGAGYTVETTLTNTATAIPVSSAVTTYVDGVVGDIETILDDIIGAP